MSEPKHTPTPWKHSADDGWDVATGRDGVLLHLVYDNPANMAFAVHAANCHDDLVEACKAWEKAITNGECVAKGLGSEMLVGEAIEKTKAILAKAKGAKT